MPTPTLLPSTTSLWRKVLIGAAAVLLLVVGTARPLTATELSGLTPHSAVVASASLTTDPFTLGWSSFETDGAGDLAWGDYDGDGDLDLAISTVRSTSGRVYRNNDGILTANPVWSSADSGAGGASFTSIAWGDADNDGDLDLAVASDDQTAHIYFNTNGVLNSIAGWNSAYTARFTDVAWGDADGDGDIDLFTGVYNSGARIFRNDNGALTTNHVWASGGSGTARLALADVDKDGDFDLGLGNAGAYAGGGDAGAPTQVYRNDGGLVNWTLVWSSAESNASYGLAWGDYDNDGDPDLAVGNYHNIGQPTRVYRNDAGALTSSPIYSSAEIGPTRGVAWGDYDSDGDLDLIRADGGLPLYLYRNDAGILTPNTVWASGVDTDDRTAVAWADFDNDGDLDLAVANNYGPNRVYSNTGTPLKPTAIWLIGAGSDIPAWGDYDGDGDLDLTTNNQLYRNNNGTLTPSGISVPPDLAWGDCDGDGDLDYAGSSGVYRNNGADSFVLAIAISMSRVVWGDVDNDGDLDLATGSGGVYSNDGNCLVSLRWVPPLGSEVVAWGDVDNDGDLDLATINPTHLYKNDNGALANFSAWAPAENDISTGLAWADFDGDGDLDLAIDNQTYPRRIYRNDNGALTVSAIWVSDESVFSNHMTWGDVDGEGSPDLITSHHSGGIGHHLYRNNDGMLARSSNWSPTDIAYGTGGAWGDVDGDGDLDLLLNSQGRLYQNLRDGRLFPGSIPVVSVTRPTANADFYSSPRIFSSIIPITYTLADPQGDSVQYIRAKYSLNGGGQWFPAVAASGTITTNLTTTNTYSFNWDTFASGFFGQSDNVVFRIEAVPAISNTRNSIPGPYLYGSYASSTFPFRVRGTQVRVISNTVPVSNAIVYRLPAGQTLNASLIADSAGQAFHTDGQGYLQGRGALGIGDKLVALLPITSTDTYTLYYTSAVPNALGLNMTTVTGGGVQTLTVSSSNPLILFNLDVSLEWDARLDTAFLNTLQFNLRRASEVLFDATNGQAALGNITIYHNRDHWDTAMVRVYANNKLRPFASIGGIVITPTVDPATSTVTYNPGQLSIGATWNRYGDAGVTIGEDWPRTLAHELSHYLFFQDDDYLGLDSAGNLIPVSTCTGTIMADPYRDDYSEFKPTAQWLPGCANTLANKTTGRSDWATAKQFYPALNAPGATNSGPTGLPLAVTQISIVNPITPTQALADPRFYLTFNGGSTQTGANARAFLFKADGIVDLGKPVVDQLLARGAEPGDRVCAFDVSVPDTTDPRLACKTIISNDDQQLALTAFPGWRPQISVRPINSVTVNISGTVPGISAGTIVTASLYDRDGGAPIVILPVVGAGNAFSGQFNLSVPIIEGYVDVRVRGSDAEVVTDYMLGGSPANKRSGFANKRSGFANKRSGFAPVISGDGQVIIYGPNLTFPPDEFYTLQSVTRLPSVPGWASVVGRGYNLTKSQAAPALTGASISIGYSQNEVPSGQESYIKVYYLPPNASAWAALTTTLQTGDNLAIAPVLGEGTYTLMSAVEISLRGPGWDSFPYPLAVSQTVTQALQSIANQYTTVYWYNADDTANPWKVYDVGPLPPYVNDLVDLHSGEAYWIRMLNNAVLRLGGGPGPAAPIPTAPTQTDVAPLPPATYYGVIAGASVGQTVTAWVNGAPCGQTTTLEASGQTVYVIKVLDSNLQAGCGSAGQSVSFRVNGQLAVTTAVWDNNRPVFLNLNPGQWQLYLPLVRR